MSTHLLLHDAQGTPLRRVALGARDTAYDALIRARVPLKTKCHGSTIGGLCRVKVIGDAAGTSAILPDEVSLLARFGDGEEDMRLACRLRVDPGVEELALSTPYWEG